MSTSLRSSAHQVLFFTDAQQILQTTSAALSSTKQPTEFDRALRQLHAQLLEMVDESVSALARDKLSGQDDICEATTFTAATPIKANDEFLNFLEIQARTQVRILEVEVRAGQELIRLHKSQFEKERVEVRAVLTLCAVSRTHLAHFLASPLCRWSKR